MIAAAGRVHPRIAAMEYILGALTVILLAAVLYDIGSYYLRKQRYYIIDLPPRSRWDEL